MASSTTSSSTTGGGGTGNGSGPSGRSPYPPSRSRRRMATDPMDESATSVSTSTSPQLFVGQGMWKISNSATSNWSPATATSTKGLSSLRFFEGPGMSIFEGRGNSNGNGKDKSPQQAQQQAQQQQQAAITSKESNINNNDSSDCNDMVGIMAEDGETNNNDNNKNMVDGIPVGKLRAMTKLALGTPCVTGLSSTGVFYASLLYAKTLTHSDAYLYSQALFRHGEYKRCVRLIEQSNIIHSNRSRELRLEAILLAAEALATLQDWQSVLDLVEDSTQQLANDNAGENNAPGAMSWTNSVANVLDDQDEIAWDALYQSIPTNTNKEQYIHPISRLCLLRGRAYSEVGHPTRAALYWKRAIKMDPKCVEALDCLLSRCVVTPVEAYELIQTLSMDKDMEWLRDFYLARIELSPQDSNTAVDDHDNHPQYDNITGGPLSTAILPPSTTAPPSTGGAGGHYHHHHHHGPDTSDSSSFALHSFDADTSSIHMMSSPHYQHHHQQQQQQLHQQHHLQRHNISNNHRGNRHNPSPLFLGGNNDNHNDSHSHNNDNSKLLTRSDQKLPAKSPMQKDVDNSFQKLWNQHKLKHSPEVLSMAARRAYKRYDWKAALSYCQQLAILDPLCQTAAYVYVSTLVALGQKRPLFALAHEWVEVSPRSARAWFAVGSYYYACERYHVAQRHFCRATRLDPHCTEAWIAFGCSFAACDESDQALASFRAAQRLSPGEYSSLLYMGMEYLRTNHLVLAQYFLTSAFKTASGGDPLCLNELGVLAIQRHDYPSAIGWFVRALKACVQQEEDTIEQCLDGIQDPYWEPTIFNLGQSYRKTRKFEEAVLCFERCVALCPENSSGYAALAFTKHLMGYIDNAIDLYHQALSCKPDDPFSSEMLNKALHEALTSSDLDNASANHIDYEDGNNLTFGESSRAGVEDSSCSMMSNRHSHHSQNTSTNSTDGNNTVPGWKSLIPPTSPVLLPRSAAHQQQQEQQQQQQAEQQQQQQPQPPPQQQRSDFSYGDGGLHISVDSEGDDIDMSIA